MKNLNNKVILKEIKPKHEANAIIYEDKDEIKVGEVYLAYNGEKIKLGKGDKVYYQYGQEAKLEGVEVILVSESNLLCQK